jgi:hypothetical protein
MIFDSRFFSWIFFPKAHYYPIIAISIFVKFWKYLPFKKAPSVTQVKSEKYLDRRLLHLDTVLAPIIILLISQYKGAQA